MKAVFPNVRLREVAAIQRDAIQPAEIPDGGIFVGLENVNGSGAIIGAKPVVAGKLLSPKFTFTPNHILYGKLRPNLRKIARPNFSGFCSTDILPILPGPRVDREFLFHYLRRPEMTALAVRRCSGANLPRLSPRILEDFPIFLPSMAEQRRIVRILDTAECISRAREHGLALARMLPGAIFDEMYGSNQHGSRKEKAVRLETICLRITDGTHQPPVWTESGVPFLFVSNIRNGEISFETDKFISEATWKDLMRRCPVERGDVLYTTVGSYGNAAMVESDLPFSFQRHIAHLKPLRQRTLPEFLLGLLQSSGVRNQVEARVRGVAQKTLNLGDLSQIIVRVPSLERQAEFQRAARAAAELIRKAKAAAKNAKDLEDALGLQVFLGASKTQEAT